MLYHWLAHISSGYLWHWTDSLRGLYYAAAVQGKRGKVGSPNTWQVQKQPPPTGEGYLFCLFLNYYRHRIESPQKIGNLDTLQVAFQHPINYNSFRFVRVANKNTVTQQEIIDGVCALHLSSNTNTASIGILIIHHHIARYPTIRQT